MSERSEINRLEAECSNLRNDGELAKRKVRELEDDLTGDHAIGRVYAVLVIFGLAIAAWVVLLGLIWGIYAAAGRRT